MSTSKLTGAFCAAGVLFLAGCETTSSTAEVTLTPYNMAITRADNDPRVPGVGYFVGFDANGSALDPVNGAVLDAAVLWLKAGSDRCIVVDAHLDADADDIERRLARTRIRTVVSYVTSRHITPTRLREGALREGLSEDTVLLREDPTCTDGEGGGGWAAATSQSGRVASLDPAAGVAGSTSGHSPTAPGTPSQGEESSTGSTQTAASQNTRSSGGSSSTAASPSSPNAGGPASSGQSSDGAEGSQGVGTTALAPDTTQAGGSDQSSGTSNAGSESSSSNAGGPASSEPGSGGTGSSQDSGGTGQAPDATQGGVTDQSSGTGNQGQNGTRGKDGVSSTTPAADRIDAGRGNGSETGDPGRSEGRNQGGDEVTG